MSTWTTVDQAHHEVIAHEAAHAAACVYLNVRVAEVSVVPYGGTGRGITVHATCDDISQALVTLAPLISEDRVPRWPVERYLTVDEHGLHQIIKRLGITEADYLGLVEVAREITATDRYGLAHEAFSQALRNSPEVSREHTRRITTALQEMAA